MERDIPSFQIIQENETANSKNYQQVNINERMKRKPRERRREGKRGGGEGGMEGKWLDERRVRVRRRLPNGSNGASSESSMIKTIREINIKIAKTKR